MADYRYLVADLLTNNIIGELPLTGVQYDQALNAAGSASGHMIISDTRTYQTLGTYATNNTFTLDYVTTPDKTAFYIERNNAIVWGGIITSRTYNSRTQTLSIGAKEFEWYLDRRRINGDRVIAAGTDQFTAVNTLITNMNAVSYGNIGITMQSPLGTSIGIPNAYPIWDNQKRTVFDVIYEWSRQNTPYGFDFCIQCAYDSNKNITKTFNLYYPRKGVSPSTNAYAPMLEFPSSIIEYEYPEDGGSMANTMYGLGMNQYTSSSINSASFAAGFPVYEESVAMTQVPDPRVVDAVTAAEVVARAKPVTVLTAKWYPTTAPIEFGSPLQTTQASVAPQFGEFAVGDTFRIRITDDRFPTTLETALRLQKYTTAVGDNGSGEIITGSFVIPTY